MNREEYLTMKYERDLLAESLVRSLGEGSRPSIKRLMTLTRILDRSAAEYAEHSDDWTDPRDAQE